MANSEENAGVDVKGAVSRAVDSLKSLIPSAGDILLEEVEISDDDRYWIITLSFTDPSRKGGPAFAQALGYSGPRYFRVFRLDRGTGEVRSMKIRETENV